FLSEGSPRRVVLPPFYCVVQFPVVVGGGGAMGQHKLVPFAVDLARAETPHGPLGGGGQGIHILTLCSTGDTTGRHRLPEAKEDLMNIPNRDPWQVTEVARFDYVRGKALYEFDKIRDDRGLAAFALRLEPGAYAFAPDPSRSDGQYVVIT